MLTRAFKPQWGDDLEIFVDDQGRRDAVDSIMANRHLIAHGKDSSVTVAKVRDWFDKAIEVLEYIETLCI